MMRATRRANLVMWGRVVGVTVLVMWAARHWVGPLCPPDFSWFRATALILAAIAVFALAQQLYEFFAAKGPSEYGIGDDGLLLPSKEHPVIAWDRLVSFTVRSEAGTPAFRVLSIYFKVGLSREVVLPGGDVDVSIVSELSKRLPESPPPAKFAALTGMDAFLAAALTLIGALAIGLYLGRHPDALHHFGLIVWLCGLAGPGTWVALTLLRRRAIIPLILLACVLNQVFFRLLMMVYVVVRLPPVAK